jgi:capsular polysaccharide biosynthesis protein
VNRRGSRLLLAATTAAGLAVALVAILLLPPTYRAEAALVLSSSASAPGDDPELARAAREAAKLLESEAVVASVVRNLRLDESPAELLDDMEVETESGSSIVRLSVTAGGRDEARRIAQELAHVFAVLYNQRFGPAVRASIWETPQSAARVNPQPARDLALGALAGLALGGVLLAARRQQPAPLEAPAAAGSSAARLAALTERERTLARRAAELALRERELATGAPAALAPAADANAAGAPAAPAPLAEQQQTPPPPPVAAPFRLPAEWTVPAVEQLLAEHGSAFPDRLEELGFYLQSLRDVARPDGSLPPGVDSLVDEVFGDLIVRARVHA